MKIFCLAVMIAVLSTGTGHDSGKAQQTPNLSISYVS